MNWSISDRVDSEVIGYEVQMDTDGTFTDVFSFTTLIREITLTISHNDTYYFRVRAIYDGKLTGSWSNTASAAISISINNLTVAITKTQYQTVTDNYTEISYVATDQTITQVVSTTTTLTISELTSIRTTTMKIKTKTKTKNAPGLSFIMVLSTLFFFRIKRLK